MNQNDHPESWELTSVGEICDRPQYGYTQSATDKPVGPKFLRITDIQDGLVDWDKVPYCECPESFVRKYLLQPGDILFARTGATTGKSYLINACPRAVFASYLIRVRTRKGIVPYFLFTFFNSSFYWKQVKQNLAGSAQGGMNASLLSRLKVRLPSCSIQQRITEIIQAVDGTIEKTKHLIRKYNTIKDGLMQDFFDSNKYREKALLEAVGNDSSLIVAGPFGSNLKVSDYRERGVPIIRLQNVEDCEFVDKDMKFISEKKSRELSYHSFRGGDIALGKLGDPVGKTCIIPEHFPSGIVVADVVRIRAHENVIRKHFLMFTLNSHFCRKQLNNEIVGTTRPRVNLRQVRELRIPCPLRAEQERIGNILSSIQGNIHSNERHLEKLTRVKFGLMQDLLTGKVRVGAS
jgi:type I restriction enzyme S subunit